MQAHARQPTKHTASPNITPYANQLTSNNALAIKSLQHPTPEWKSDQTPPTQDPQPSNSEYLNYPDWADGEISLQYIWSNLQTDPRNQITISRETNHIPTTPWEKIDDTFSNQGKSTPIDKSVTHLKNNAIRVKDFASHQQNHCAPPTSSYSLFYPLSSLAKSPNFISPYNLSNNQKVWTAN